MSNIVAPNGSSTCYAKIVILLLVGPNKSGKTSFAVNFKNYVEAHSYINSYVIFDRPFEIIFEICRQLMMAISYNQGRASTFIIIDKNMCERKQRFELTGLASMYQATIVQLYFEFNLQIILQRNDEEVQNGVITYEKLIEIVNCSTLPPIKFYWENNHIIPSVYLTNINAEYTKILEFLMVSCMFPMKLQFSQEVLNFYIHTNRSAYEHYVRANGPILMPYLCPKEYLARYALLRNRARNLDNMPLSQRYLNFFCQVSNTSLNQPHIDTATALDLMNHENSTTEHGSALVSTTYVQRRPIVTSTVHPHPYAAHQD